MGISPLHLRHEWVIISKRRRKGVLFRRNKGGTGMGWWIAAALAALAGLAVFLAAPGLRRRKDAKALGALPFAHRGLHGGTIPENSLSAFERAAEAGYGIELDVRMTRDGHLAVFHDDSLLRLCGVDRALEEMTLEEARRLSLPGSGEKIPLLAEALAGIRGRTPLIIEMKSAPSTRKKLPGALEKAMRAYRGVWCVESFDPRMLLWFRRHAPGVLRGQLAFDPRRDPAENRRGVRYWLAARLLMNFLSRPDFIAYGHKTEGNAFFRMIRALFHPATAAWTVRSKADFENLKKRYDIQIFEAFIPDRPKPEKETGSS